MFAEKTECGVRGRKGLFGGSAIQEGSRSGQWCRRPEGEAGRKGQSSVATAAAHYSPSECAGAPRSSRPHQDGGGPVARGRSAAAGNPAAAGGELRAKAREQRAEVGAMLFPGSAVGYR